MQKCMNNIVSRIYNEIVSIGIIYDDIIWVKDDFLEWRLAQTNIILYQKKILYIVLVSVSYFECAA